MEEITPLLCLKAVAKMLGWRSRLLRTRYEQGNFPAPIRLSGKPGRPGRPRWRLQTIQEYIKEHPDKVTNAASKALL